MSRPSTHYVRRSFNLVLSILIVSSLHGSDPINLDSFLNKIEIADSSKERRRGLMYRNALPQKHGMLFIWDSEKIQCMWMKNTYIPLSVAYADAKGKIINISDMKPLSRVSICSDEPAIYALEVNQGFFERSNINSGDILAIEKILQNDK